MGGLTAGNASALVAKHTAFVNAVADTVSILLPPQALAPAPGKTAPTLAHVMAKITGEGDTRMPPLISADGAKSAPAKLFSTIDAEDAAKTAGGAKVDADFFVEPAFATSLEKALAANLNVLLVGPAGCGKSELLERVATRVDKKAPFVVSLHGEWSADDFFGGKEAKDGSTYDRYGIATQAMMLRRRLILHEFDAAPPEIHFALQRVLEKRPIVLTQFAGEDGWALEINPWAPKSKTITKADGSTQTKQTPSRFSVLATANTLGHGDDSGLYRGTKALNHSTLDRFDIIRLMDYPPREVEIKILCVKTGINNMLASKIVGVAGSARKAFREERKLLAPITVRQTTTWAKLITLAGLTPEEGFLSTVLDRNPVDDRKALVELYELSFGAPPSSARTTIAY